MGGQRPHHPRRGSLGYSPRKRASRLVPRIKSWPVEERIRMQGFSGYKAGTTHVFIRDSRSKSPTYGEDIVTVATILETPPIKISGIRGYGETTYGLKIIAEARAKDENKINEIEKALGDIEEIRVIARTQPRLSAVSKKKEEVMEYNIGGPSIEERFNHAKEILGKEVRIGEVFEEGEGVDTISVTKGKGFQGPMKKWGVRHLPRKTRKGRRTAGSLGPWHPAAMMWTVPQAGQMGYHRRTEYNKRILKIGENGGEITPDGGFLKYGVIKREYILLHGTIPGPRNRIIRLRPAIRPPKGEAKEGKLEIAYISIKSKQGV